MLVTGDREYREVATIRQVLTRLQSEEGMDSVVEGEARGADLLARQVALELGVEVIGVPANWVRYGKAAGVLRNQRMLELGQPDLVVAFHDRLKESRGTKDMVSRARRAGIPVRLIEHTEAAQGGER